MVNKYRPFYYYIKKYKLKKNYSNDLDSWLFNNKYREVYNKLWLSYTQDIDCAPMGIYPNKYPVIIKPIINLYGMSRGFRIIKNEEEYDREIKDGYFWQPYFKGKHYCIDIIYGNKKIYYFTCLESFSKNEGIFDYHIYRKDYVISEKIKKWLYKNLKDYRGCLNIEVINGKIIECHLRLNGDFHLYDSKFATALKEFEKTKNWEYKNSITNRVIVPIFINKKEIEYVKKRLMENSKIRKCILKICRKYRCNTLDFCNIDSISQREDNKRILIFDIDNIEDGKRCKNEIIDILKIN